MPGPPRARPILIGAVAAAVIVGLVVLLGALSSAPAISDSDPDRPPAKVTEVLPPGSEKRPLPPDPIKQPVGDPPPIPDPPKPVLARTTRDLVQFLKQPVAHIRLAADTYELRQEDFGNEAPGLVFRGTELTLEPDDPLKHPTIILKYDPSIATKNPVWAALTVLSGQVKVQGIQLHGGRRRHRHGDGRPRLQGRHTCA